MRFVGFMCVVGLACGQKLEFDVADIRQNVSGQGGGSGGILPGGQFSEQNVPLKTMMLFAFDEPNESLTAVGTRRMQSLEDAYIVGAPKWVDTDRFDIVGRAPANSPPAALAQMLRSLLEK